MRHLVEKKWLRRTVRGVAVVVTLTVLGHAAFNWWAAREKQAAEQRFLAGGGKLEMSELVTPLPPDEENFAMIPVLAEMRRECQVDAGSAAADRLTGMFRAMKGPAERGNKRKPASNSRPSAIETGEAWGLKGDAGEMLTQYDALHREAIETMRSGMERRFAVAPKLFDLETDEPWFSLTCMSSMSLMQARVGLNFRTRLAVAAGRPEAALESLRMSARISAMTNSEGTVITSLVAAAEDWNMAGSLKEGLEAGIWSEDELREIQSFWPPLQSGDELANLMNGEALTFIQALEMAADGFDAYRSLQNVDDNFIGRMQWRILPEGCFDLEAARSLDLALDWMKRFRGDRSPAEWMKAAQAERARSLRSGISMVDGTFVAVCAEHAVKSQVLRALSMLAIELELHRLEQGHHPDTLDSIAGRGELDPLTGEAFRYAREGEGYRLYSVGPDGNDDGGEARMPGRTFRESKDWVW